MVNYSSLGSLERCNVIAVVSVLFKGIKFMLNVDIQSNEDH